MFYFYNGPVGYGRDHRSAGWPPQVPSEVAGPNQLFYQELEALAVIGLVAMVLVIITS